MIHKLWFHKLTVTYFTIVLAQRENEKGNKKKRKKILLKILNLSFRDFAQTDFLQNYGVLCKLCNLCENWMASGIGWRHDIEMRSN